MTVNKRRDDRLPHAFMHKVADVRGGVSVDTAELGGDFLPEGAVLTKPVNGITHLVKIAVLTAAATNEATSLQVKKNHNLKKGDVITFKIGGAAYAITAIDTTGKTDIITLSKTLGVALAIGDCVSEAKESGAEGSALKYEPFCVNGTGQHVKQNSNLATDAWIIGVTKDNPLPDYVAEKLKGIINY